MWHVVGGAPASGGSGVGVRWGQRDLCRRGDWCWRCSTAAYVTCFSSRITIPYFTFSWPLTFSYSCLYTIFFGTWCFSLAHKPLRCSYSALWYAYLVSSLYKPLYFHSTDLSHSHTLTEVSLGYIFLCSLYFWLMSSPSCDCVTTG